MWTLLSLSLLTWAADKAIYPPQKIKASGIERIEITGVRGSLHLTGSKQRAFSLRVKHSKKRSDDWSLLVERRGSTLVLEVASAAYGREWSKQIRREDWPEFDITLIGPARPTVVSWREGSLEYENWGADLDTSFLSGAVKIQGGRGKYRLQAVNSDLTVNRFNGELSLNGEGGDVELRRFKGNLNMEWLKGQFVCTECEGKMRIEARDMGALLKEAKGEWDVRVPAGKVEILNLSGNLKGYGQSSTWSLKGGSRRGELEIVTESGPVNLKWPGPARVFLTSDSGSIHSPYGVEDRDGRRVAEGKRGSLPLGQVFVRTASGAIVFTH
ncbi:MAG: hypothetical protein KF799_12745 [Bdellovibrionales bacterium]|nr:hypothetical protein [Bdellovibrionales bacterium]